MLLKSFLKQTCYRCIPSKFPPIALFEDVANADEFEALYEIQSLTNPRIQDDIGNIDLIPKDERCFGVTGAGFIMAAFTHVNPNGSRFSNGDYGIFYAASHEDTALQEALFHRTNFLKATLEPAQHIQLRSLKASFSADLIDILINDDTTTSLYSLDSYQHGQQFGARIKQHNQDGIVYHSVRAKGINYALFKPSIIHQCQQAKHYTLYWDGIGGVF